MDLAVVRTDAGHRLVGEGGDVEIVNAFLGHLGVRNFSPATGRACAFDLLNFLRFCSERQLALDGIVPTDMFDWLEWQSTDSSLRCES